MTEARTSSPGSPQLGDLSSPWALQLALGKHSEDRGQMQVIKLWVQVE